MTGPTVLTAKQRQDAFHADLLRLLKKHNAELEVTTEHVGGSYGYQNPLLIVSIPSEFDEQGNTTKEYAEFDYSGYIFP